MDSSPYEKLATASSIRLLTLLPGTGNDEIVCQLQQADLHDKLTYESLSYVWGDPSVTLTITCQGYPFEVTVNLFLALQRLRKPDLPRLLWADAICVNQQDLDERSQQVTFMKNIYESADKVVIWLGPDYDNCAAPAAKLTEMVSKEICRASGFELPALDFATPNWRFGVMGATRFAPFANLLSKALGNPGDFLARRLLVFCGDVELNWDALGSTVFWVQWQRLEKNFSNFNAFRQTNTFKLVTLYDREYLKSLDWLQLLHYLRGRDSIDPRDNVYGLLGLPPFSSGSINLSPNYNKSRLEVYRDVAEAAIRCFGNLRILSYTQHSRILPTGWPTWIPCWDLFNPVRTHDIESENLQYRASGDVKLGRCGDGWKIAQNILSLPGIPIDTVARTGNVMYTEHFSNFGKTSGISHSIAQFFLETLNENWLVLTNARLEQILSFCFGLTGGENEDGHCASSAEYRDQHLANFADYMSKLVGSSEIVKELCELLDPGRRKGNAGKFELAASRNCKYKRLFLTEQGYVSVGPEAMQSGDRVCILFGLQLPAILRPHVAAYQFVGDAYMYGLMNGEALEAYSSGKQKEEVFSLC